MNADPFFSRIVSQPEENFAPERLVRQEPLWAGDWRVAIAEERVAMAGERLARAEAYLAKLTAGNQ